MDNFYDSVFCKEDESLVINLKEKPYNEFFIKIVKWDIDENGELSYDMKFSKPDIEKKYKDDQRLFELIENAMVDIVKKSFDASAILIDKKIKQEEELLKVNEMFTEFLSKHGLKVPDDVLAIEYAAEQNAVIGYREDKTLGAIDITTGKEVDIEKVVEEILLKHPINKIIGS